MTGRMIQLIFGVIIYLCSTPFGMAKENIPEESRAVFLAAAEVGDDGNQQTILSFEDAALLPNTESLVQLESSVGSAKQVKRGYKRISSPAKFISKCRLTLDLSPRILAKGIARHPLTQDALQERTAAIRFLQLSALI